jgi:hypothetical protein
LHCKVSGKKFRSIAHTTPNAHFYDEFKSRISQPK